MKIPFKTLYDFVKVTCSKFCIDETHAIRHSMDVCNYANLIFLQESPIYPHLKAQQRIIYTSAIIHDMCDSKYMKQEEGIPYIKNFLDKQDDYQDSEKDAIINIISTMSYSKVKKNGFPDLGIYQQAYHIVRESDLLCGYDFDRCLIYGLINQHLDYETGFLRAKELYSQRMAKQIEDNLFTTAFAQQEAIKLDKINRKRIMEIEQMLNS